MSVRNWRFWVDMVVVSIVAFWLLDQLFPDALADENRRMLLVYLFAVSATFGGVLFRRRTDAGRMLHHAAIWAALFCVVILAYSFRAEFMALAERFQSELMPLDGRADGERVMSYPLARGGQFDVRAVVDGVDLVFTIDTGADDVVLSPDAATRLGFDLEHLDFSEISETANGYVRGAPVVIAEFRLGTIVVHDLPASVNEVNMSGSLLGMEFLRRLKSWHVEGDRITLTY